MGRSAVIRAFRDDDVPGATSIWRELRPDTMHSERGLRHLLSSFPERAQAAFWAAEDEVVAWCFAHRRWHRATDNGFVWLGVRPEARRRGLGSALWERAEKHLDAIGVARINADVVGDKAGARFLERRGFEAVRTVVISAVDPRRVNQAELTMRLARAERAGYRLVPYAEVDVHALFALELALSADEPGEEEPRRLSFEEWRVDLFEGPDMTQQGSFAVVSGQGPVAYAALSVDASTGRGRNEGIATAAAHRRRGPRHPREARAARLGGGERHRADRHRQRRAERADARDQPPARLRAVHRAPRLPQGALSGNGFRARAGSTCAVTQTGVVTYRAE
jgi:GNAT superfamily N-acetyltransferase